MFKKALPAIPIGEIKFRFLFEENVSPAPASVMMTTRASKTGVLGTRLTTKALSWRYGRKERVRDDPGVAGAQYPGSKANKSKGATGCSCESEVSTTYSRVNLVRPYHNDNNDTTNE